VASASSVSLILVGGLVSSVAMDLGACLFREIQLSAEIWIWSHWGRRGGGHVVVRDDCSRTGGDARASIPFELYLT
jgi:hypothetical protein